MRQGLADAHVGVFYNQFMPPDLIVELEDELRTADLAVVSEGHEDGPQMAASDWTTWSVLVLWLADKFFGAQLEEAGKDGYLALKRALQKVSRRLLGPNREVRVVTLTTTTSPRKALPEPEMLSILTFARTGQRVKFRFDHELTGDRMEAAVDALRALMAEHHRAYPADALSAGVAAAGLEADLLVVMRYEVGSGSWRPTTWRRGSEPPDGAA